MARQAKENLRLPVSVGQGICGLCLDKGKQQQVWGVDCIAFTGKVCTGHMEMLTERQNGNEIPEATLFDKAS